MLRLTYINREFKISNKKQFWLPAFCSLVKLCCVALRSSFAYEWSFNKISGNRCIAAKRYVEEVLRRNDDATKSDVGIIKIKYPHPEFTLSVRLSKKYFQYLLHFQPRFDH